MHTETEINFTNYNIPSVEDIPIVPVPFIHRVIIMPIDPVEKTRGGLYLPETSRDAASWVQHLGIVVACGPTAFMNLNKEYVYDPAPKRGDIVMYGKFAGTAFWKEVANQGSVKNVRLILVQDTDIVMKFERDEVIGIRTDK